MDETTQQNAALVEEATAAARSMEEQAMQLTDAVAQFRLAESAPAKGAAPGVRPKVAAPAKPPAAPPRPATRRATVRQPVIAGDGDWQEF